MIRSIFVLMIVLGMVPVILRFPPVGVLMWSWISYMNPHRLTWGVAQTFHVAGVVGGATLIAILFSGKERKLPIKHPLVTLMIIYALWTTLTTFFALNTVDAWDKWAQFQKIMLFDLVTTAVMISKTRLVALIWVITLSLGFYGIKGGFFTILGGGGHHVLGPPRSFIGATNSIALALVMIIPLFRFLHLNTENKHLKLALLWGMALTIVAVMGTQSRGGAVALAVMLFFSLLKSRNRVMAFVTIFFTIVVATFYMPARWTERMETVKSFDTDKSFQGRANMWRYAIKVANERPILGGGFDVFYDQKTLARLLPPNVDARASHSTYFEVLGEHGYVGLALFLITAISAFLTGGSIIRKTSGIPELRWAHDLASMLQISLVGYAVHSIVINKAIFDLYWHYLAILAITAVLVEQTIAASHESTTVEHQDRRLDPALAARKLGRRSPPKC